MLEMSQVSTEAGFIFWNVDSTGSERDMTLFLRCPRFFALLLVLFLASAASFAKTTTTAKKRNTSKTAAPEHAAGRSFQRKQSVKIEHQQAPASGESFAAPVIVTRRSLVGTDVRRFHSRRQRRRRRSDRTSRSGRGARSIQRNGCGRRSTDRTNLNDRQSEDRVQRRLSTVLDRKDLCGIWRV